MTHNQNPIIILQITNHFSSQFDELYIIVIIELCIYNLGKVTYNCIYNNRSISHFETIFLMPIAHSTQVMLSALEHHVNSAIYKYVLLLLL